MIIIPKIYDNYKPRYILYQNIYNFFDWECLAEDIILDIKLENYFLCLKAFKILGEALIDINIKDIQLNNYEYLIYVLTSQSRLGWVYSLYFNQLK